MNLEDRLRAELERSGRSTRVGTPPSIDTLASVADGRRHRNRVAGAAGAVVLSGTLILAAFVSTQPDDAIVVAADDGGAANDMATESALGTQDTEEAPIEQEMLETDDASAEDSTKAGSITSGANDSDHDSDEADNTIVLPSGDVDQTLQADGARLDIATRASAVDFAGGSGVLVVPTADGYRGLATTFGEDGAQAIGLSSPNGLDWVEVELVGVPDGATATVLRQYDGGYVALFEHFDVAASQRRTFVAASDDLVNWAMSDALSGRDVVATDLAVGSAGVMIIGDAFMANTWVGPVGGPYVLTGQLDTTALYGVTTLGDEFLVAGHSPELGITVYSTADGVSWGSRALAEEGAGLSVSVADGTIVLTTVTDDGPLTSFSSDGGNTWDVLSDGDVRSMSVSGSSLGFISGSEGDATVTLADGVSLATADLDVAAPDRLTLLATTQDEALMLVLADGGAMTWVVASR